MMVPSSMYAGRCHIVKQTRLWTSAGIPVLPASHAFCYRTVLSEGLALLVSDAGPSRADTEPRWGNKFVPSSSGGGFEDRDRGSGFGDRDRASSRGEDTWGRRPSDSEPPSAGGGGLLLHYTLLSTCSQCVRHSVLSNPPC